MNLLATNLLSSIATATVALTIATLLTWLVLRLSRTISPSVHRLAWCAALLVGCSFVRLPIEVPWYAPPATEVLSIKVAEAPAPESVTTELHASPAWQPDIQIVESIPGTPPTLLEDTYDAQTVGNLAAEVSAPLVADDSDNAQSVSPPVVLSEPIATPSTEQLWRFNSPTTAIVVWLAGMLMIVVATLIGYILFIWRLPDGLPVDSNWLEEWQQLLASRGVRQNIPLRVTNNLGPLLCRMPLGYCLAIPEALWRELDAEGRVSILKHELAHFERGDVWRSLAVRLLALPQWFNPCSWFAVRRFDEAAEWACDRAVADEHSVADYARTLLRLGTDPHGYASYRPAASGKPLAARVRRLLRLRHERDSRLKGIAVIAAAIAMALFALVRVELVAQEPPATEATAATDDTQKTQEPATDSAEKPADQSKQLTAAQATTEAAQKAFDGNWTAYKDGKATLDAVYIWSLRWLQAAERSPPQREPADAPMLSNSEHRLRAAKEHLARMKKVQEYVKAKFDVAARGGEHERMMEANFYVADAEQRIADLAEANRVSKNIYAPIGTSTAYAAGVDSQYAEAMKKAAAEREAKFGKITRAAVDEAQKAYTATLTSYLAGSSTLDAVIHWSTEWLNAEQRLPSTDIAKFLEAEKRHLRRLQELQKQVKTLHESGSLGGQAENMASVNFHVAQAELRVAELEPELAAETARKANPTVPPTVVTPSVPIKEYEPISNTIELKVNGPDSAKVGEKVTLEMVVTNGTQAASPGSVLILRFDKGLKHPVATSPIERDLSEIAAGGSKRMSVDFQAIESGELPVEVEIHSGGKSVASKQFVVTVKTADGATPLTKASPIVLKIQGPPIKQVGETAEFKIFVENQGQTKQEQLKLHVVYDRFLDPVTLTDGYKFMGDTIGWEIAELPPGKSIVFDVNCKCLGRRERSTVKVEISNPDGSKRVSATTSVKIGTKDSPAGDPLWDALRFQGKSADEWSEILKTELSEERQMEAIDALAAFVPKGHGREIATMLFDVRPKPDSKIEHSVLNALYQIPRETAVPVFAAARKSDAATTRRLATIALAVTAPSSAETKEAIQAALRDPEWEVTEPVLNLLGSNGPSRYPQNQKRLSAMPELAPDLYSVLEHFELHPVEAPGAWGPIQRGNTIRALARCGPAAKIAFPIILPWLTGNNYMQRDLAFEIVGVVGAEATEAVPALIDVLKNRKRINLQEPNNVMNAPRSVEMAPSVRALTVLRDIGPAAKAAAPVILEVTAEAVRSHNSPVVQYRGFEALEAMGLGKSAVPELIQAIKNGSYRVQMIEIVGKLGPDAAPALEILQTVISSAGIDEDDKLAAVRALGSIGPAAKPAIGTLLQFAEGAIGTSTSSPAMLAALQAIQSIGAGDETPTFVGLLTAAVENDETNRIELIKILAALGAKAQVALPVLEKLAKDQSEANNEAAQAAAAALKMIQRDPKSPVELFQPATSEKE